MRVLTKTEVPESFALAVLQCFESRKALKIKWRHMQQNIFSLKTENRAELASKKRPFFLKSSRFFLLFCSFFVWKSGQVTRTRPPLAQCRPFRTNAAKLQRKSVHKQSVKLLILFFFFLRFYTVSFIYNKITHHYYYISFLKKEPHPCSRAQEEKIDHIRRVSVWESESSFSCLCRLWSQTPLVSQR